MTSAQTVHVDGKPKLRERFGFQWPRGLFVKYAITIVCLVLFVIAMTGTVETWIIYRETTTEIAHTQKVAADAVAHRTDRWLIDLQRETSWVTRASATTLDDHRADYKLLLERVPSIEDLAFIDGDARQQLLVSRDTVVAGANLDLSQDPITRSAAGLDVWFGPTSFEHGKPSMVLTMSHPGDHAGITIAHVGLGRLTRVADATSSAGSSQIYILDHSGKVLATSDDAPMAVGTDLAGSPALEAARSQSAYQGWLDLQGRSMIVTTASIDTTGWTVLVAESTKEALLPIREFLVRLAGLMALGLILAVLAGLLLARRMIVPIQALHAGAAHLAANRFNHRISIHTGDELEDLADQFNRMADELAGSYGRLELKVEERTKNLAKTVRELQAIEESGRALASSLDIVDVLATINSRAIKLVSADAGAIFAFDALTNVYRLEQAQSLSPYLQRALAVVSQKADHFAAAVANREPSSIADLDEAPSFPARDLTVKEGFHSALVVGLIGSGVVFGMLVLFRRATGDFPSAGAMKTLANQAALSVHNASLFQELVDKGHQLEVANAHRTQFFANMSHELRTPLNAVLGYSELLSDGLYGEMPDRAVSVLDRIQHNGKHLLAMINDVLDVTKMEAGALNLSLGDYSIKALVENVIASTESLAQAKGLAIRSDVPDRLPTGRGDDRRLTQVLLNLVGNAIKFTDHGEISIHVVQEGKVFRIDVHDTGPGIPEDQQAKIFEAFRQVDDAHTLAKGGTGLGLSIAQRLVKMHGGEIGVTSAPGQGATFTVTLPIVSG